MMKGKRISVHGQEEGPTMIKVFRDEWLAKGFELVDVTQLCNYKLGVSGWCNDFNEPDEQIYHIKVLYRGEEVCSFPDPNHNIDDKYVVFITNDDDVTGADFIIFRKTPTGEIYEKEKNQRRSARKKKSSLPKKS